MMKWKIKNINKVIKRTMLAFGFMACVGITGTTEVFAAEKTGKTIEGHPIYDNNFEGTEILEGEASNLVKRGAIYPAKYDPRLSQAVTGIEDQGDTNSCWAFSIISAIESNLIKKGYATNTINLSENHLAYFFYNRVTDKLGYTAGDYNRNISGVWWDQGGTIEGAALHLMTGSGVVKQTTSEDDAKGEYAPAVLAPSECYKSDYTVKSAYFYNYSVDGVKKAITDYGAVACGMYVDSQYFNKVTGGYYCPVQKGNHAVAIVGWDDSYSRNNFKTNPKVDGAWIVKNSYGTGTGDNGYWYISYADASLTEIAAFDVELASSSYGNNYQHDGSANPASYLDFANGTTYVNLFTAKASANSCNEILKAVSIDTLTTNINYSIQVYTGITDAAKPTTSGKAVFSTKQTGRLTNAGYNQIALNTPVTLNAGEKYAVAITVSSTNLDKVRIACDTSISAGWISFLASGAPKQSFVHYNNKWYDLYKSTNANVRIKAYTDTTAEKTTYKLNNKSLGLSKGSSTTLKLITTPTTVKRKITWSSSNKSVATVSSSGKVKAKAYGTATIKAKFVSGKSTKTLKCTVTVGPSKVKNFKVSGGKKKITVKWKRNSAASGYVIYYSTQKNSGYKALGTVKSGSKTSYTKKKLAQGTYYVKMRPYLKKGGKKLYGSYTSVKKVTVK